MADVGRKITGAVFVSLDGVMQGPGGPDEDTTGGFPYGGWWAAYHDEEAGRKIGACFDRPFALLLGRRTYDIFAAYWPFMPDDNPIAAAFARADKYVLTRSDIPLDWRGSHRLTSIEAVAELKAGDGPDLLIQGSSTLYPQLLAHGLLDRLELLIAPVVLGRGKRLFAENGPAGSFRVVDHSVSRGGVVMTAYEPAGAVRTGSFVEVAPSERELARRAKIESGSW